MGTMRLVVDAPGQRLPEEVGIEWLPELLADPDNRLRLDLIYGMNSEHLVSPAEWKLGFRRGRRFPRVHGGLGIHPLKAAALALKRRPS